ncbi:D-alanine--poly(phosphoribitol) ligase subunit DltA [Candidatus Enterococcus mangumiae]|uniref:D-alanine--D-alanyl carrier protein ligase n=1 Tax=Candidatus Enterococcus mangumiae TaxID=2230878 RepID=A0ABZ2T2P5_9ENTE|nr:D-alanine--poly(phosphoribitol) ligase subunit DltA [Enterococcus sp. DIV1094]MBO0490168.1 D-alanine--poly(phosphoribitol) ligase subunit DltA [Enterococcus sp. DIV1094]
MKKKGIVAAIDFWGVSDPERIAYQTSEKNYTYKELKQSSDALGYYLEKRLLEKGPIVVFGNLEFEMVVAFLGASKAGHAYLPIDAQTPKERIEAILRVAEPSMIISLNDWEIETEIPVIHKDCLHSIITLMVEYPFEQPVKENENFYLIFTSGTTGEPKGVQISHDNLVSFVDWVLTDFPIKEGERFLAQAPFSFDLSVFTLYPALVSGGIISPLSKEIVQDFQKLFTVLPQLELNFWVSTPSFVDMCLMDPAFDAIHLPELSTFIFCGEELTKKTAQALVARFPLADIYNTYGPTEATVAISSVLITKEILARYERLPIGYVKSDTAVSILKKGEGDRGEILITGPSVSKGYLNNPEKTKEVFFQTTGGRQSYRTGDAGYLAEDGLLFIEGRIDQQVKLHGYRIELGDIEHALLKDERINQAIVVPKYQGSKVQQLVAFVVLNEETPDANYQLARSIKQGLSDFLMDYMIPQRVIFIDQLPQTNNGKIDRKALTAEVNR